MVVDGVLRRDGEGEGVGVADVEPLRQIIDAAHNEKVLPDKLDEGDHRLLAVDPQTTKARVFRQK